MRKLLIAATLAGLSFAGLSSAQVDPSSFVKGTYYTYDYMYEYQTNIFSTKKVCVYQKNRYVSGLYKGSSTYKSTIWVFQECTIPR